MDVTRPSLRRIALGFMLPSYDEKARAEREFPACGLAAAPTTNVSAAKTTVITARQVRYRTPLDAAAPVKS